MSSSCLICDEADDEIDVASSSRVVVARLSQSLFVAAENGATSDEENCATETYEREDDDGEDGEVGEVILELWSGGVTEGDSCSKKTVYITNTRHYYSYCTDKRFKKKY